MYVNVKHLLHSNICDMFSNLLYKKLTSCFDWKFLQTRQAASICVAIQCHTILLFKCNMKMSTQACTVFLVINWTR